MTRPAPMLPLPLTPLYPVAPNACETLDTKWWCGWEEVYCMQPSTTASVLCSAAWAE